MLVVEDNPVNRKLTEHLLRKLTKCEIASANDGQEALRMAQEHRYDLILDCQMPVMDGYQATAAIRA